MYPTNKSVGCIFFVILFDTLIYENHQFIGTKLSPKPIHKRN